MIDSDSSSSSLWETGRNLLFFGGCIGATLLIGWIRFFTGPEWELSLFYLLPIMLAVWHLGRLAGILVSLCSAASWLTADIQMLRAFSNPYIPFINETFRLLVFLIITFVLDKLRVSLEDQRVLARNDALTQVPNRRGFVELAHREMEKARRNRTPLTVIYLDIDDLKTINDRLGHDQGDRLLYEVAQALKKNIRAVDILARLGGDEFCVLLNETGADEAVIISKKLHGLLSDMRINTPLPVTFSVGVATFETPFQSITEMVNAADCLMYEVKRAGKDGIRSAVIKSGDDKGGSGPGPEVTGGALFEKDRIG
ncbi:MAG: diguanylate cyclase [Deltaproteobacteria bacterium]|nr:diguanylate cyclase [Deltaproteobacteria bacterium]MBW1954967.1 diguanylate cyclase [Deltaproteobacteria bacterium]MBW2041591.1 diguanylate cyclase [Deltaproteobacteria bacterium]MBW2131687.1 diguanylate cyclase [Deltaproteobacteria bacterium]